MRKLALFAVSFSAAVFAWNYGVLPFLFVLPLLALLKKEHRWLRCGLVCAGVVLGLLWPMGYDAVFRGPIRALEGQPLSLTAEAADWPSKTGYGAAITVRVRPEGGRPFLARLYGEEPLLKLEPGDTLHFTAMCRAADQVRGGSTAVEIPLLLYAKGDVTAVRPDRVPLRALPAHWRQGMEKAVAAAFPPDVAALVTALLTGDKSGLPDADYVAFQRAGLAHVVAVSGLHIGFLIQMAAALAGNRYRRRMALLALPAMVLYALLAGGTPSVVRAVLMNALLLLGPLLGRESDPPTSLSFALMVLLAFNPYAAQSVSLQLSFASVAGILALSGRAQQWLWGRFADRTKKLPKYVRSGGHLVATSLSTTAGAVAFTTPLVALYFGSVSLVTFLSNLLCLGLVALLFQGGVLTVVLTWLTPELGGLLGAVLTPLARLLMWLVHGLARLPWAAVTLEGVYLPAGLLVVYLLWLLFFTLRGPRRPLVPLCCSAMVLCVSLVLTHAFYHLGPLTLTVLDVGQGQCTLLRAGDRTALVDCGGNARRNAGDRAADYLSTLGGQRVDLLVLTHFHADHTNGVLELLERLEVSVLAVPDVEPEDPLRQELLSAAEAHGVQIWLIREDVRFPFGSADLTLYAPLGAGAANEEGLSFLCETEHFSALLTGDMGADVEARLVKYGDLPDVDLLVAGHHGSKNATSQRLLDAVTPELAVISSGYNSYGHPAPEALLRLDGAGCEIYRTDLQGAITVTVR